MSEKDDGRGKDPEARDWVLWRHDKEAGGRGEKGNAGARARGPRAVVTQTRYLSGTLQVLGCGEVNAGAGEGLLFT